MATKYDVKHFYASVTANTSTGFNIGGGPIASGKKRFLTYLRIERVGGFAEATNVTDMTLVLASATISNASWGSCYYAGSGVQAMPINIGGVNSSDQKGTNPGTEGMLQWQMPSDGKPDIRNPIFGVAGPTAWMRLIALSTPALRVYAQWYDEGE
jgi:hypothetical protein